MSADAEQLATLIETRSRNDCLDFFRDKLPAERRSFAKTALKKLKQTDQEWLASGGDREQTLPDKNSVSDQLENAKICVLATATPGELKKLGWRVVPHDGYIVDVVRALDLQWANEWIQDLVENEPHTFVDVRLLYHAGLCDKPTGDGYILGMISSLPGWRASSSMLWGKDTDLAERIRTTPDIRDEDVWRLFEVEGGGDLSLAAFDKYEGRSKGWAAALTELGNDGTLSRDRLLDESLNALERDFAQFRAGWFSRFHEGLEPTFAERAARLDMYLRLLGSSIGPTVSFALNTIKLLDKAGELSPQDLLANVRPVLLARGKGTVVSGLRLLSNAAKREPEIADRACRLAAEALIHEAADVQKKTLDLIELLKGTENNDVVSSMLEYADSISASLRKRFDELTGHGETRSEMASQPSVSAERSVEAVTPIATFDELNHAFLQVLEDASNPSKIERVIDGVARLGADGPADLDKIVGPLAKRAKAIIERQPDDTLQYQLARFANAFATSELLTEEDRLRYPSVEVGPHSTSVVLEYRSFEDVFLRRNIEVLTQVRDGKCLPLMGAPTDSRGYVSGDALIERYLKYRNSNTKPGATDMALALMRLAPEGREELLSKFLPNDEYENAIAFALGAELPPQKTDWLWVAAAAARLPYAEQPAIAKKHGRGNPDAGILARYAIRYRKEKYFTWLLVFVEPKIQKEVPKTHIASTFHVATAGSRSYGSVCGYHVNMIRWSSTIWPLNLEAFFSQGVLVFDHNQRLANSPYAGFIEPLVEPHHSIGPMGAALLTLGLASNDPAVKSVALDAAIAAVDENRFDANSMRQTLTALLPSGHVPIGRWTKSFGELSGVSPKHAAFVRDLITGSLRHDPKEPPRDIGGLVELLYELSVATETPITDTKSRAWLGGVSGGGKLKRFAGKLLALQSNSI